MNPLTPELTPADDEALALACKALAHPARLRILRLLLAEDRCICGRIVEVTPLAQSTVSQHLKILKEGGLIRGQVEGRNTCYCADRLMLERLGRHLDLLITIPPNQQEPI